MTIPLFYMTKPLFYMTKPLFYMAESSPIYNGTSPAGSLLAVRLHSEDRVTLNGKYEI